MMKEDTHNLRPFSCTNIPTSESRKDENNLAIL